MKAVLWPILGLSVLAACAKLPDLEASTQSTPIDGAAAETTTVAVPPSVTPNVEDADDQVAEVTESDATAGTETSSGSAALIDEELLAIAGAETPQELFASPGKQRFLMTHLIKEFFPDRYRTMLAIANCESTGLIHWQADGSLLPQERDLSSAAGVFQVLRITHGPDIRAQDLDLNDPLQYMEWVRFMVDRNPSLSDWAACLPSDMASN